MQKYIVLLEMYLWITELISVVCDENSKHYESLGDIEVEKNGLVKKQTAENNLKYKKNKGMNFMRVLKTEFT